MNPRGVFARSADKIRSLELWAPSLTLIIGKNTPGVKTPGVGQSWVWDCADLLGGWIQEQCLHRAIIKSATSTFFFETILLSVVGNTFFIRSVCEAAVQ
jgi:hypothetical protein